VYDGDFGMGLLLAAITSGHGDMEGPCCHKRLLNLNKLMMPNTAKLFFQHLSLPLIFFLYFSVVTPLSAQAFTAYASSVPYIAVCNV